MALTDQDNTFRIAVVGCGPRGMYCLDELARQLESCNSDRRVIITIYEPAETLGAGNVYNTSQPHFLRMNFAAKFIDAWRDGGERTNDQQSLVAWLANRHPGYADDHAYVPRAIVGQYLSECFRSIDDRLAKLAEIHRVQAYVSRIARAQDRWIISTSGTTATFDDVVTTIGHEGWRESSNQLTTKPVIPHVFPVQRQLSIDQVPSGATIAIRGFGLTAIDAVLTLTEGRAGQFTEQNGVWHYRPSGDEPAKISPFSRTGRPMLAKPIEGITQAAPEVKQIWQESQAELQRLASDGQPLNFQGCVWPVFLDAADQALRISHNQNRYGKPTDSPSRRWFAAWSRRNWQPASARKVLARSYQIAVGQQRVNAGWAIAEAWRRIYPALVEVIGNCGLDNQSWDDFWEVAAEMERIAFGPPAENVGRLLALIDCGIVDLKHITDPASEIDCDLFINAVLPSPRDINPSGPLADLRDSGIVDRPAGAGGINVDIAGRPVSADGIAAQGLAVLGRVTEGCVIGNDTLSRKLHDHPHQWARSVVANLTAKLA